VAKIVAETMNNYLMFERLLKGMTLDEKFMFAKFGQLSCFSYL